MADLNGFEILASRYIYWRLKFQTRLDQPFLASVTLNLACKLLRYPQNWGLARDRKFQHFEKKAHSTRQLLKTNQQNKTFL